MSVLSREKQLAVLAALVDGNSEHAVERMTEVHRRTIRKLALRLGEGAQRLHDRLVRDLQCHLIEVDELWSYVGKKQARIKPTDSPDIGETYTFVALDQTSRMVISFHVGKRDQEHTDLFIADLRSRLLVMPQITSDGWAAYPGAIGAKMGPGVDYAQMHKVFRTAGVREDGYRMEQPRNPIVTKHVIFGAPDMKKVSTSYTERNNGTMRHFNGRMRRAVYETTRPQRHSATCITTSVTSCGHYELHRPCKRRSQIISGTSGSSWMRAWPMCRARHPSRSRSATVSPRRPRASCPAGVASCERYQVARAAPLRPRRLLSRARRRPLLQWPLRPLRRVR